MGSTGWMISRVGAKCKVSGVYLLHGKLNMMSVGG
jgi:hypothetical protein